MALKAFYIQHGGFPPKLRLGHVATDSPSEDLGLTSDLTDRLESVGAVLRRGIAAIISCEYTSLSLEC